MAASILRPPGPAHTRPFKTLHQFIHNPIKILTSLAKEYGDISYIKLGRQNVYLIVVENIITCHINKFLEVQLSLIILKETELYI